MGRPPSCGPCCDPGLCGDALSGCTAADVEAPPATCFDVAVAGVTGSGSCGDANCFNGTHNLIGVPFSDCSWRDQSFSCGSGAPENIGAFLSVVSPVLGDDWDFRMIQSNSPSKVVRYKITGGGPLSCTDSTEFTLDSNTTDCTGFPATVNLVPVLC